MQSTRRTLLSLIALLALAFVPACGGDDDATCASSDTSFSQAECDALAATAGCDRAETYQDEIVMNQGCRFFGCPDPAAASMSCGGFEPPDGGT